MNLTPILRPAAIGILCMGATSAQIVVTSLSDEENGAVNGISLREAIGQALPDAVISFDQALSGGTILLSGTQLLLDRSLTIEASDLAEGVTIDADGRSRVFEVASEAAVELDNLTITGGRTPDETADAEGGGILNHGELTLTNCLVSGNRTGDGGYLGAFEFSDGPAPELIRQGAGGGIYNSGTLTLRRTTIRDNRTGRAARYGWVGDFSLLGGGGNHGGGVYNEGALVADDCDIEGNVTTDSDFDCNGFDPSTGGHGGGIYNAGTAVVRESRISENVTEPRCLTAPSQTAGNGGGIYNDGMLALTDCTLRGNWTYQSFSRVSTGRGEGGGLFNTQDGTAELRGCSVYRNRGTSGGIGSEGSLTLTACTIVHNPVGGGIACSDGDLAMRDCTVVGNTGIDSGGLFIETRFGIDVSYAIDNCIIAANSVLIFEEPSFADPNLNVAIPPGSVVLEEDPELAPLGDYGGATLTMPPVAGSPAIDSGESLEGTDQRGVARDDSPDVGAVEHDPAMEPSGPPVEVVVDTAADEDDGSLDPQLGSGVSLREAVNHAPADSSVTFSPALSGEVITLAGSSLKLRRDLSIDATALDRAVTIDANEASRVLEVYGMATVRLKRLHLRNGSTESTEGFRGGGGIYNRGTLRMEECGVFAHDTGPVDRGYPNGGYLSGGAICNKGALEMVACSITENQSGDGGSVIGGAGIYNEGTVMATACLIANNLTGRGSLYGGYHGTNYQGGAGKHGGGVYNKGSLRATACTIGGNRISGPASFAPFTVDTAGGEGGGIYNAEGGELTLNDCTISDNHPGEFGMSDGEGGGIFSEDGAVLTLHNCLVAGNGKLDAIWEPGSFSGENNLVGGSPGLAPLGDYGGPTLTMMLLPGSPAIDAGATAEAVDQRGYPRDAMPDIGAFEFEGTEEWALDLDGDGTPYGVELFLGRNPFVSDSDSPRSPSYSLDPSGEFHLTFGFNPGLEPSVVLVVMRSLDLESWDEIFRLDGPTAAVTEAAGIQYAIDRSGSGLEGSITIVDTHAPGLAEAFYRLEAALAP